MQRRLDWNDLRYFLELARQRRLGPTAKRLKVDTATVSRRIAELERGLGEKLFGRSQEGFCLSDAGQQLLPHAEAIELHVEALAEGCAGRSISGRVRLASMEGIASQYLSTRLPRLHQTHPDLLIEVVTSPALFNLTRREADIAISFVPVNGRRLRASQIGEFSLFLYAAPSYLEERGMPKDEDELKEHDFVDYVEDLLQIREVHWLLDVVREPSVVLRSSSMFAQQSAAASGAGLVLLPSFAGERDPRLVPVLKRTVSTKRPIILSCHEDLGDIPRIRAVTHFLTAMVKADQDFLRNGLRESGPVFGVDRHRKQPEAVLQL